MAEHAAKRNPNRVYRQPERISAASSAFPAPPRRVTPAANPPYPYFANVIAV